MNRTYLYQYDAKDNLTKVTDPINGVTNFSYDSFGQLAAVVDSRGNTVSFAHDTAGNITSVTNPAGGTTTSTYDGVGRLASQTDAKGQTFAYIYDAIDRLTSITQPGGSTTNYTYGCCKLTSISDLNGTLSFAYDAANRLTRFTNTRNQAVQYAYDAKGNLTALTYPDGKVVHYEYNEANRLKKVADWLNDTTTYSYDGAGNLISAVNTNGTISGYQYDAARRLISLTNSKSNGSVISGYRYTLNGGGNRTDIGVFEPTSLVPSPRSTNYAYGNDDRLVSSTGSTYTHDPNGNLTAISGTSPANYAYDAFDRLTQTTVAAQTTQYQYDATGNRTMRTASGNVTRYITSPGGSVSRLLAETDNSGNITSYYVYGQGLVSKITPTGQAFFYHYDATGNTTSITDGSGNLVNRYAYDPFGNLSSNSTETISNPFRFAGALGVTDEGNGLLYMRARYASTRTGRFLSKDPIGLSGQNMYLYAANNPILNVDPSGLISCDFKLGRLDENLSDYRPNNFDFGLSFGVSSGFAFGALFGVALGKAYEFYHYGESVTLPLGGVKGEAGLMVGGGVAATSGLGFGISQGSFHGYFLGWQCDLCK